MSDTPPQPDPAPIGAPGDAPPFENGGNGKPERDERGRFQNFAGPGARPRQFKARLDRALKLKDIDRCVKVLRQIRDNAKAKPADRMRAIEIILDRMMGRVCDVTTEQRLAQMEELMQEMAVQRGK